MMHDDDDPFGLCGEKVANVVPQRCLSPQEKNDLAKAENVALKHELGMLKAQKKFDALTRENVALKQELEAFKAQGFARKMAAQPKYHQAVAQPRCELVVTSLCDEVEAMGKVIEESTPAPLLQVDNPLNVESFEEDKEETVTDNGIMILMDNKVEPPVPRFVFVMSNYLPPDSPLLLVGMPPMCTVNGLDGMVDKLTGDTIHMYYKFEPPDPEFVIVIPPGLPPIKGFVHNFKEYRRHQPSLIRYRYLISCLNGTFDKLGVTIILKDYKSKPPDFENGHPKFKSRVLFSMSLLSFPTVQTRTFHSQGEENDMPSDGEAIRLSG